MNLSQLRYAAALAHYRSFSAAAESLFVAQPTLSQQIKALEEELGVDLFIRTTRSVSLTDAGIEFCSQVQEILSSLSRLESTMRMFSAESAGTLRVGLIWSFTYFGFDEMLNAFRTAFPEIRLQITIDGTAKLNDMIADDQLDLAIINTNNNVDARHYLFTPLLSSPLCAVISIKNHLSQNDVIHASDLIHETILLPEPNSAIGMFLKEYLQPYDQEITVLGSSGQIDTCISVADTNLGISFVTESICSCFADKNVKAVPLEPEFQRITGIISRKTRHTDPLIKAFTEFAKNHFGFYNL